MATKTPSQTVKGTLAADYLKVGDVVLLLERRDVRQFNRQAIDDFIHAAGNRLEVTVLRER